MRALVRWVFRWLFRLLVLAIVLAGAALLLKDTILKALLERRVRSQTGLEISVRRFEAALLSPVVTVEDLRIYNPPEFGGTVFLRIPELSVEYDLAQLALGRVRLTRARLNLSEVNIVRNAAGQTNLTAILARCQAPTPGGPAGRTASGPSGGAQPSGTPAFGGIDRLYLSLGVARYTDQRNPAANREFALHWKDLEAPKLKTSEEASNWAAGLLLKAALQQFVAPRAPAKP